MYLASILSVVVVLRLISKGCSLNAMAVSEPTILLESERGTRLVFQILERKLLSWKSTNDLDKYIGIALFQFFLLIPFVEIIRFHYSFFDCSLCCKNLRVSEKRYATQ